MNIKFNYVDANYKPYDMSGAKVTFIVVDANNAHYTPAHFNNLDEAQEYINELSLRTDAGGYTVIKESTS